LYILRFFITTAVNFFIGLIVYIVICLFYHILPSSGFFWIGLGILLLFVINFGHLILAAYWGVRFRDLSPALSGIFQILFYVTPIIFTADMLQARGLHAVYLYNPLYYVIEVFRYPLLHGSAAPSYIYKVIMLYGIFIWTLALFSMFKYDRKVAYWL